MNSAADRRTCGVPGARLPDVSELSLRAIFERESVLGRALERSVREAHSGEDLYAAFGSFAPDGPT